MWIRERNGSIERPLQIDFGQPLRPVLRGLAIGLGGLPVRGNCVRRGINAQKLQPTLPETLGGFPSNRLGEIDLAAWGNDRLIEFYEDFRHLFSRGRHELSLQPTDREYAKKKRNKKNGLPMKVGRL